ncbi:MAG: ROK family protein [candidate division Zixibacteria bacterium]|nr:ROK family protein [candidate division Zixibacteria bacterium]
MPREVYAGIDLGGTAIKYGLVAGDGRLLATAICTTPVGRAAILRQLVAIIHDLQQTANEKHLTLAAVGIGSAGIVDPNRGQIIGRCPNIAGWQGTEVKREIESATGLPVRVDNDANAMALAEHRYGAGKGFSSGIYITVGTGIGSGIILDGRLWRGAHFAGAEFGHTIIVKGGRRCPCGKQGCLEMYAATGALRRYYGKRLPPEEGARPVFQLARTGDQAAQAAILKAADYLAAGIGSVLELINPECVVIGGGVTVGRGYLKSVRATLPRYSSRAALHGVKVKRAKLGNNAGLIGAALLCQGDNISA